MNDTPRIYVASLSDYNAGRLHGKWFDLTDFDSGEELYNAVKEQVLDTSQEPIAEEWAIHDHEGFGPLPVSEHESFDELVSLAHGVADYGEPFLAWVANDPGGNTEPTDFEDAYRGEWGSLEDYAAELISELYDLDSMGNLAYYIDYEKFARDLELGGDVWTHTDSSYRVHVFWNH